MSAEVEMMSYASRGRRDARMVNALHEVLARLSPVASEDRLLLLHPDDYATGVAAMDRVLDRRADGSPGMQCLGIRTERDRRQRPGFGTLVIGSGAPAIHVEFFFLWRCPVCARAAPDNAMGPSEGWDPWHFSYHCSGCRAARAVPA